MNIEEAFKEIEKIYYLMPSTTCHESSCSNWCCTKMLSQNDKDENIFMPLPLVYGIEYLYILNYLKIKYPNKKISELFDFSKKSTLCPFKEEKTKYCLIYPVRPFSCRVYGRRVPPVFWGTTVTLEQANAIFCKNMTEDETHKKQTFDKEYPKIWIKLAELSYKFSPFSNEQKQYLMKLINFPTILVLAFGEYYFLTMQNSEWYENNFLAYWKIMGNRL